MGDWLLLSPDSKRWRRKGIIKYVHRCMYKDLHIYVCTDAYVKILQVYIQTYSIRICTDIFAQMWIWEVPAFWWNWTSCYWRVIAEFGLGHGGLVATATWFQTLEKKRDYGLKWRSLAFVFAVWFAMFALYIFLILCCYVIVAVTELVACKIEWIVGSVIFSIYIKKLESSG